MAKPLVKLGAMRSLTTRAIFGAKFSKTTKCISFKRIKKSQRIEKFIGTLKFLSDKASAKIKRRQMISFPAKSFRYQAGRYVGNLSRCL